MLHTPKFNTSSPSLMENSNEETMEGQKILFQNIQFFPTEKGQIFIATTLVINRTDPATTLSFNNEIDT